MSKFIKTIISGPAKPAAPAAVPLPPAEDPAAKEKASLAAEEERRRVMAGGRAANVLISPLGDTSSLAGTSARKMLLGH